jgi:putative sterol carrier protein
MLDFIKVKTDLEESFNTEKSVGVAIDINVTVVSEDDGKFSVSVFEEKCFVNNQHLPDADITVGFVDKDTMIEMFTKGKDPVKLVMGGKMTFNGDMGKGKALKGLFVGEE